MQTSEAVTILSALASASRLAVFRHLVAAGPAGDTPGRIADRLSIPPSTLSFHLKELALARLVTARPSARHLVYAVDFPRMAALMTYLTHNCCRGMPAECLTAVETELSACLSPACAPTRKETSR